MQFSHDYLIQKLKNWLFWLLFYKVESERLKSQSNFLPTLSIVQNITLLYNKY